MEIIVAGSRDFNDYELLEKILNEYIGNEKDVTIISGTARGADRLGEAYAKNNGYKLNLFPAEWNVYGKSAGYKRNVLMSEHASDCVVFWDGISKGTKHMIDIIKANNEFPNKHINLKVVNYTQLL